MSSISNTNVGPAGQVITSSEVNTKFTDVATATGAINGDNVRSGGVDRRTLAPSRAEPLAHLSYTENGPTTQGYLNQTGESVFQVNHGTDLLLAPNFTLKDGDLVRINFTIRMGSHDRNEYYPYLDTTDPSMSIGLLFFPVWKTDGGGWSVLPGQTLLNQNVTAPAFIGFDNGNLRTDSAAWLSLEGIDAAVGLKDCRNVAHGAFYYKHTGADMVVDEIRLNGRGPVAYEYDTGTTQKVIRIPDWNAAPYNVNHWSHHWVTGDVLDIYLQRGQLSFKVLRGDS